MYGTCDTSPLFDVISDDFGLPSYSGVSVDEQFGAAPIATHPHFPPVPYTTGDYGVNTSVPEVNHSRTNPYPQQFAVDAPPNSQLPYAVYPNWHSAVPTFKQSLPFGIPNQVFPSD
jgi:hypothetical protein